MPLKPEMAQDLRAMVRDVLRDVMAQRGGASVNGGTVEAVRIASDHDLAAFVARILDPAVLERVRSGQLRFTLGAVPAPVPASAAPYAALTGVITEQKIDRLTAHGRLVLAPGAVLTPLARDKARKLGLVIERRS
jgi:hypothetical protein